MAQTERTVIHLCLWDRPGLDKLTILHEHMPCTPASSLRTTVQTAPSPPGGGRHAGNRGRPGGPAPPR
jgi:hypothetical protein